MKIKSIFISFYFILFIFSLVALVKASAMLVEPAISGYTQPSPVDSPQPRGGGIHVAQQTHQAIKRKLCQSFVRLPPMGKPNRHVHTYEEKSYDESREIARYRELFNEINFLAGLVENIDDYGMQSHWSVVGEFEKIFSSTPPRWF
jgi:hypothetical protein